MIAQPRYSGRVTAVGRDASFLVGFHATESAQILLGLLTTGNLREAVFRRRLKRRS